MDRDERKPPGTDASLASIDGTRREFLEGVGAAGAALAGGAGAMPAAAAPDEGVAAADE